LSDRHHSVLLQVTWLELTACNSHSDSVLLQTTHTHQAPSVLVIVVKDG